MGAGCNSRSISGCTYISERKSNMIPEGLFIIGTIVITAITIVGIVAALVTNSGYVPSGILTFISVIMISICIDYGVKNTKYLTPISTKVTVINNIPVAIVNDTIVNLAEKFHRTFDNGEAITILIEDPNGYGFLYKTAPPIWKLK